MAAMLGNSWVSGFPVIDRAGQVIGVAPETDMVIQEADQASHPTIACWPAAQPEPQDSIVPMSGRLETGQARRNISQAVRHIERSSPPQTSWALRTTACTRPHPHDTCFTSLWSQFRPPGAQAVVASWDHHRPVRAAADRQ